MYFDNVKSEITVINAEIRNFLCQAQAQDGLTLSKFGLWNPILVAPLTEPAYACTGIYASAVSWFFFVGGSVEGASIAGGFEHHIYNNIKQHKMYRWIDCGSGLNRNLCIKLNWDGSTASLEYAEFVLVAGCDLTGTDRYVGLDNQPHDPADTTYRNAVIENNRMHGALGDATVLTYTATTLTLRDNEVWDSSGGRWFVPVVAEIGAIFTGRVYRNKIYHPATANANDLIDFASASWTQLQTITDNIIVDLRTLGRAIAIPFTQQTGATIDRNQYYAPNDSDAEYLRDVTTTKTFAE
jgi:hypothetical protein